jgi:hypothetical protein
MRIFVKVKPGAKEEKIEKIDEAHFVVFVKEAPEKGKANEATIKVLAEHFRISKSDIKLISGFSSKNKIFEVK